jgi:serine phosphatase RsbU (regulator of sigma subunit)
VTGRANAAKMVGVATTGSVIDLRDRPADDEARVRALEDLGVLDAGPEERFDRITRLAQQVFGVATASVNLIDRDRQYVKSSHGGALLDGPRTDAICDHTIRTPDTLVVEDAAADARFAQSKFVTGPSRIRFYAGHPLEAPGGHRIGTLCLADDQPRRFGARERMLLRELARWVQYELTRSAELDQAAEVQRRLLPRRSPEIPGYEIAGACLPSRGVGGDFLDWYGSPDGQLTVTLGDVMGKGMAAAIIMATVRAALRSTGRSAGPAAAVSEAAATLQEDLEETGTLVTLCHARLSPDEGVMRYTDAGHGLMLLLRADGAVRRPTGGGFPLGVSPDETWTERQVELRPGDVVLAFSDGLLDLYDGTLSALDRVVEEVGRCSSAQEVVDRLTALARRAGLLDDDVTVLAIRRSG